MWKLSVLSLILLLCTQSRSYSLTVVVDPGHGGGDKGAVQGTIKEADITLNVALKLAAEFSNDPSVKIILTRPANTALSLKKRIALNESYKGDLFISLHVNASIDKRAKGADFYIGHSPSIEPPTVSQNNRVDSIVKNVDRTIRLYQSQFLASDIFDTWKDSLVTLPRSIKQGPFYVINRNKIPSLLVELGFITNTPEALELIKEENQTLIAKSLHKAIKNFQSRKLN